MEVIIDSVQSDFSLMLVTYLGAWLLLMGFFVRIDAYRNAQQRNRSHLCLSRLPVDRVAPSRLGAMQRCSRHHDVGCTCFLRDQTPR
jgi:hypothetical protein